MYHHTLFSSTSVVILFERCIEKHARMNNLVTKMKHFHFSSVFISPAFVRWCVFVCVLVLRVKCHDINGLLILYV